MGFRVVNSSSFTFETDLPPSARNIHPSGVLHAFRSTTNAAGLPGREEHTFAWIRDSIHADKAVNHLEKFGFKRDHGIVFIPYSTKTNWLNRYPHAAPSIECTDHGFVLVYLNWRPYPNGLADLGQDKGVDAAAVASVAGGRFGNNNDDEDDTKKDVISKRRKSYRDRALKNIFQDNSCLPDAERDELHVEIYNYLSWLHSKLAKLEEKAYSATTLSVEANMKDNEIDPEILEEKKKEVAQQLKEKKGVDVTELKGVLEKLNQTFAIIPNVGLEETPAAEDNSADEQGGETPASTLHKGVPFLEESLSLALQELVLAREVAGKPKRRSRKKPRERANNPNRVYNNAPKDFDMMFQKLVEYKEVHGDCTVQKNNKQYEKLGLWVRGVREKKAALLRKGIDIDVTPQTVRLGEPLHAKLTAERLERLKAIGFVWTIMGPKTPWEDRFRELVEYYEINGKWPSQSMGSLGMWVHKQRKAYTRGSEDYMKHKAPKLDEIGFEWTPRGNTRMSWDEGFEMLMEFGRVNGHYNVPEDEDDSKSDARRLFNWVESLHKMYRSYKLGRQSGSLTDERIVLLVKHGFMFRDISA